MQTVINAGNQVNEAMADCMAAREKNTYYQRQVQVLREAYTGTHGSWTTVRQATLKCSLLRSHC